MDSESFEVCEDFLADLFVPYGIKYAIYKLGFGSEHAMRLAHKAYNLEKFLKAVTEKVCSVVLNCNSNLKLFLISLDQRSCYWSAFAQGYPFQAMALPKKG